jgi:hypothetical protein
MLISAMQSRSRSGAVSSSAAKVLLPRNSVGRWPSRTRSRRRGEGMNMYAYVKADPVNFVDPSGLERQCATVRVGGSREYTADGGVIVTLRLAEVCWDTGAGGGGGGREGGGGGTLTRIGEALDKFAEDNLKPPEARRRGETRRQCVNRIAGTSPALGIVGAFSIAAGGPFLGYPRVGLDGGGRGTSLTSSAARGALGKTPIGGRLFGTGNVGGVIGRGVSTVSVVGGAAAVGWAAGTLVGAVQRCR